ncbi:hypothetical protein OPT61_g7909 [Boeremia exigua]|uniref:Uncharacterized protein n=1 Tax=Boeremia exigua TaxID=749465 RepID=A0ACC2I0Z2_9PLEO|nr:hypothetical protein OPT61_g7909 [Boeremia exigua]
MEHVHIAALRPNLDALESKQIKAVVTLIWPYSSSQRQFALLLAEPDLRLRRKRGQVRARFSSTSARALAATGVGIGDDVVLSLHGAQFLQDGAVSTPGKSIDWELAYTQTLAVSVRRDGVEIASLELVDAALTPAPRSPVKKPAVAPSPIPQWSSPAFLKRARLSDGPFLAQPAFDPLSDEGFDGHDKKRRRKSYRDWTAWTYTARTPSPEKEDVDLEDELADALSSPSRRPQLPKTPISPLRTELTSVATEPAEDFEYVEETTIADSAEGDTTVDDGELQKIHMPFSTSPERPKASTMHDGKNDDVYAANNEAPLDSQYDFGGDTELNTEDDDEDEDVTVPDVEAADASTTDAATELEDEPEDSFDGRAAELSQSVAEIVETADDEAVSAAEDDSESEVIEHDHAEGISEEAEGTTIDETVPEVDAPAIVVDQSVAITMPPPNLPALHTDFATTTPSLLTPIGIEPSSPNLKAVDSATLPLPSPFPGEQFASYFEQGSAQQVPLDGPPTHAELEAESDADYIMESSFFSSIGSSRAGGLHQDHETAFTPLRFTFGTDGAGWSRPLELSSPPPEEVEVHTVNEKDVTAAPSRSEAVEAGIDDQVAILEQPQSSEVTRTSPVEAEVDEAEIVETEIVEAEIDEAAILEQPQSSEATHTTPIKVLEEDDASRRSDVTSPQLDTIQPTAKATSVEAVDSSQAATSSKIVLLSSDMDSDQSEPEDMVLAEAGEELDFEETGSASDEEVDSFNEDRETEIEGSDAHVEQVAPHDSQTQTVPDTTVAVETGAEEDESRLEVNISDAIPASESVTQVVDLGSPSASGSSDEEEAAGVSTQNEVQSDASVAVVEPPSQAGDADNIVHDNIDNIVRDDSDIDMDPPVVETAPDNFDDFISMEVVQERTEQMSSPSQPAHDPASTALQDHYKPLSVGFDDWQPQLGMDEPLSFIENLDSPDAGVETIDAQVSEHPDVKTEIDEDRSSYLASQSATQDVPQESATDPATEIVISVPEDGHKIGELQSKSIPATSPARNTRSKTKSAASPPEEDGYISRVSTSVRRTRSKASFDATNLEPTSPTHARGQPRSTASPIRDRTQTSPYSLRSQSKHLSPDYVGPSQTAPVRRSPRKVVRRDSDFDIVPSQAETRDTFGRMFEPSQELGFGYSQLSQGRFSDVHSVKDSEEDTIHSEGSLSTVQYSDTEVVDGAQPATPRLKAPPANISQTQRQTRSRSRSNGQQSSIVSPGLPQLSPIRSPRRTRSTFSASPSPRIIRTTRELVQVTAHDTDDDDQRDEMSATSVQQSVSIGCASLSAASSTRE